MEYLLNDDQKLLVKTVREFAKKEIAPKAQEMDEKEDIDRDVLKKMIDMGLFGIAFHEEYGGGGEGLLTLALIVEELSRASASIGATLAAHYLGGHPIEMFGTEEQKKKYIPLMASGERICAFALTEPNAGSDVSSIQSTAVLKEDYYILNGSKCFISNGGLAGIYTTFVKTDKTKGNKGISAFILEKEFEGFSIGKKEKKMGLRGSPTAELIFDNCKVPKENLLGKENEGFSLAMKSLDPGRITTAAYALGLAQGAMDEAVEYSKNRVQFGRPISQFQLVQAMLADMSVGINASRLLIYNAAILADRKESYSVAASMAKLMTSDTAMKVTTDAVQVFGGYGYMREYPVERMMRDAKIIQILEGTNQIQRVIIARDLLK
jgi:alkylation response protein AidB-like acyl-CoA dehydrogenase